MSFKEKLKDIIKGIQIWVAENKSDWNENDVSSPRYIKNRTHWIDDGVEKIIIKKQDFQFEGIDWNGYYESIAELNIQLIDNQEYSVCWDGTVYKVIAKSTDEDVFELGAPYNWDDDLYDFSNIPFAIYYEPGFLDIITASTNISHEIGISAIISEIHKIDKKFLPLDELGNNTNILNGSARGSLRTINAAEENSDYSMGENSFAIGTDTMAPGTNSHAEGLATTASGWNSHAEGNNTTASGNYSHAEGYSTTASGPSSHTEGESTTASGASSHAEGYDTVASGNRSHAEGSGTIASGESQHVQGKYNVSSTSYAHIVGNGTGDSNRSNAHTLDWSGNAWYKGEIKIGGNDYSSSDAKIVATTDYVNTYSAGRKTHNYTYQIDGQSVHAETGAEIFNDYNSNKAVGEYSHAEGSGTIALGDYSHAEGEMTTASGMNSHAENRITTASGRYSHAEGLVTTASGDSTHSEGNGTVASGESSHAEGYRTTASGRASHAEGYSYSKLPDTITSSSTNDEIITAWNKTGGYFTLAKGDGSHAEGNGTLALGISSHAEGYRTQALGNYSHAEGYHTQALGDYSHAEGNSKVASGKYSHAEGDGARAIGDYSHAEGQTTVASGSCQHVQGRWNIEDTTNTYAHIVGNGQLQSPSNAHTLDWKGNAWYKGDVYIGGTSQDDTAAVKLATESYVLEAITNLINSSPETLNTLGELAKALNDDPNFATTITNLIATKADKEHGHANATQTTAGFMSAEDKKKLDAISVAFDSTSNTVTFS